VVDFALTGNDAAKHFTSGPRETGRSASARLVHEVDDKPFLASRITRRRLSGETPTDEKPKYPRERLARTADRPCYGLVFGLL